MNVDVVISNESIKTKIQVDYQCFFVTYVQRKGIEMK